jgi:FkbM family methyltransferase
MSENLLAKLTSYKWLKEATSGRAKTLINSIGFTPHTIEREVAGEVFPFYIGSPTGKAWYGSKKDEAIEMRFVKSELIKPGMTVIECGAHHGAQSILLSRWVGRDGKVIAIEPIPENVQILRKNIELNQLENVMLINKAVGPGNGYVSMKNDSNGMISILGHGTTVQVECITIDRISHELNLVPSLLKIDVEGFEYQLLEGCKTVLSYRPCIFLEVHPLTLPRYGNTFEDLWNFINPEVYDIFIQADDLEEPSPYLPSEVPRGRVHLFFRPH